MASSKSRKDSDGQSIKCASIELRCSLLVPRGMIELPSSMSVVPVREIGLRFQLTAVCRSIRRRRPPFVSVYLFPFIRQSLPSVPPPSALQLSLSALRALWMSSPRASQPAPAVTDARWTELQSIRYPRTQATQNNRPRDGQKNHRPWPLMPRPPDDRHTKTKKKLLVNNHLASSRRGFSLIGCRRRQYQRIRGG